MTLYYSFPKLPESTDKLRGLEVKLELLVDSILQHPYITGEYCYGDSAAPRLKLELLVDSIRGESIETPELRSSSWNFWWTILQLP